MYMAYARRTRFGAADPWIRENRYADSSVWTTTKVKTYGVDRTPKGLQNRTVGSGSGITMIINTNDGRSSAKIIFFRFAWSRSESRRKQPQFHAYTCLEGCKNIQSVQRHIVRIVYNIGSVKIEF